jgi:hypothetical protein
MAGEHEVDESLFFTVATVWREERVSCPHQDILRAYGTGALETGAMDFVRFHLQESQCPYCSAVVEDQQFSDGEAAKTGLDDLRDRLLRSTVAALRRVSGA